jgi:hypothetical protein
VDVLREDAHALSFAALAHQGARPVAEQDRQTPMACGAVPRFRARAAIRLTVEDVPVDPRHEAGMGLGADDHDAARGAAREQCVCDLKAEQHGRALGAQVERGHTWDAEFGAKQRPGPRKHMVRGHRVEQDVVDVRDAKARRFQCSVHRGHGEVASALSLGTIVPLLDPRALTDPFVARVHHARQVVVGVGLARQVPAAAHDAETGHTVRSLRLKLHD